MPSDGEYEKNKERGGGGSSNAAAAVSYNGDTVFNNSATSPAAALEFNGRTVHSFTYQNTPTEPASSNQAADADDFGDQDNDPQSFGEMLLRFMVKTTPFATATKMALLGSLMAVMGALLFTYNPDLMLLGFENVTAHWNCLAFAIIGHGLLLALSHTTIVFLNRQESLYKNQFVHFLTEFEEHVVAAVWMFCLMVLLGTASAYHKLPLRAFKEEPINFILRQVLLNGKEPRVHLLLICIVMVMIIGSALKRHFIRKSAIEFNYSNYCDRVEGSLFVEASLQSLMRARQAYRFRKKWKAFLSGDASVASGKSKHKPNDPSAPASASTGPSSPQFVEISRGPSTSSAAKSASPNPSAAAAPPPPSAAPDKKRIFEDFARLAHRTETQFDTLSGVEVRVEIHREARRLAAQIFKWVSHPIRGDVTQAELEPFFDSADDLNRFVILMRKHQKSSQSTSADTTFTEADLRRTIDASLQERFGLAKSMETIQMALGRIDTILNWVLGMLGFVLAAKLIFGSIGGQLLNLCSALLVPASFLFEKAAKNTFESIIFLLVIHPFDIGDRVFIRLEGTAVASGDCTDNLLVVEMNLMSTVFERWDGLKIYVPNNVLAYKPVYNLRRSGPTIDVHCMAFAHSTSIEAIETLRQRLLIFLRQNRQDYTEFHRVNVEALENCNKIIVKILVQHATNWQDLELQMARRTKVLSFLKTAIDDLQITYLPPVQRVQLLQNQKQIAADFM